MSDKLTIEQIPARNIQPDPHNARTHSKKQIRQIAASIREFGFVNPLLIDEANRVIAGHGRLAAARLLDLESVPAIQLTHLSAQYQHAAILKERGCVACAPLCHAFSVRPGVNGCVVELC